MKLLSARVSNFRSAEDSEVFSVDHLTCFVGKNEAGKTAILQALAGLNPHPATPFGYVLERDYPKRYLARYSERHPDQDAVVVTSEWEITDETKEQLVAEFGDGAVTDSTVKILRSYDDKNPRWRLPIDHAKAIEYLVANSGFSAPEKSQVGKPKNSEELKNVLGKLETPKHKALLEKINSYPNSDILSRARDIIEPYFPQFMYFSNYDRMSAVVHLPSLKEVKDSGALLTNENLRGDRLFLEFLEFSGIGLEEILDAQTFESFNAKLQAGSNILTEEILEYWTQNPDIEVRVNVADGKPADPEPFNAGAVGRARIYNQLHRADTSFSERSAGFTWFFSFLIKFDRVKKEGSRPVFLLLDEPGLTLHGKAQGDLLRYFQEKLSPHHQMIYSTHSPFMVSSEKLMSARIVEDLVNVDDRGRRTPIGTKVKDEALSKDRDSVFPLQGALGYEITQTLFIGKHTLLVEGPSDVLYLQALSTELGRRGRTALDPSWVMCPTGGLDKIQAFVSLFSGNSLDVIALTDYSKKGRSRLEAIRRSEILKSGGLLTIGDFVSQEEADIEDIFEPALFVEIVNSAYELPTDHAMTKETLLAADENSERLVKKAEAYFNVLPNDIPTYDHFRPSLWLISHPDILRNENDSIAATLDRTEDLCKAINALRAAD